MRECFFRRCCLGVVVVFYERVHELRLAKLLAPVGDELAEETAAAVAAAAAAAAAAFDP